MLALTRQKKKKAATKTKQTERHIKNNRIILLGSLIAKAIDIEYTQIDAYLPKIIGLLEHNKQQIKGKTILVKKVKCI